MSNSVRIARLIAVTVVAVATILGAAIILAAYIQTRHATEVFQHQQNLLVEKSVSKCGVQEFALVIFEVECG